MVKQLDASKLVIGIKKDFRKDAGETKNDEIENAVRKIHEHASLDVKHVDQEATKRTTLDIPKSLHKKISQRVLDRDLSLKDYFLELAKRDLESQ